jgi:hypothetical protein
MESLSFSFTKPTVSALQHFLSGCLRHDPRDDESMNPFQAKSENIVPWKTNWLGKTPRWLRVFLLLVQRDISLVLSPMDGPGNILEPHEYGSSAVFFVDRARHLRFFKEKLFVHPGNGASIMVCVVVLYL